METKSGAQGKASVRFSVKILNEEICIVFDHPVSIVNISGRESVKLGRTLIKAGKRLHEAVRNKARMAKKQKKKPIQPALKPTLNPAIAA